jgi:glycosyltransferase involved in cell wall biosynthesis
MPESATITPTWALLSPRAARPLKILHVIAPARVGGLESVVCTLVPAQRAAGIDAQVAAVVVPEERDHPVATRLREAGVTVEVICVSARSYSEERRLIAEKCRQWAPDVVHTHGYRSDLVDSPVAARLDVARVSTFHGFTGGTLRNRFNELLQRRAGRAMDAVIAVSGQLGDRLAVSGIARERLHVVPNGYSRRSDFLDRAAARRALGLPANTFVIGWIGRLTNEKGADVLIDALSGMPAEGVVTAFIGDGGDRARLERRAELRAPGRVRWHGLLPDAARLLKAFDVFVLSSRTEGTPIVIFEAMDAGVPIVATRVGGVPDVLRPDDALLVAPENSAALGAAIRSVRGNMSQSILRARSASERLATTYAVDGWVERHQQIYRQVARQDASRC